MQTCGLLPRLRGGLSTDSPDFLQAAGPHRPSGGHTFFRATKESMEKESRLRTRCFLKNSSFVPTAAITCLAENCNRSGPLRQTLPAGKSALTESARFGCGGQITMAETRVPCFWLLVRSEGSHVRQDFFGFARGFTSRRPALPLRGPYFS